MAPSDQWEGRGGGAWPVVVIGGGAARVEPAGAALGPFDTDQWSHVDVVRFDYLTPR